MEVPFLDLKTQYQALKKDIDFRVNEVFEHGQFILGPEVKECESELAKLVGCEHAITCASGTDALIMSLIALKIAPGDEVITSAFSFVAAAEAIALLGAQPVLVDIDLDTYNLDANQIEAVITPKTKAIIPVALYGQPADMDEIQTLGRRYSLSVIEDAAQSLGATYNGSKSGILGDIGCTSFFPAKPLGCYGDGGALFTNNSALAEKLFKIRVHGQSQRYQHTEVGINGRLDTLQCAILLAKLKRFPWEISRRQLLANRYTEAFQPIAEKLTPPLIRKNRTSAYAQYTLFTQAPQQREAIRSKLNDWGIPTAVHYPAPVSEQPAYEHLFTKQYPNSQLASQRVFSLPLYADLSESMQDYVIERILQAVS